MDLHVPETKGKGQDDEDALQPVHPEIPHGADRQQQNQNVRHHVEAAANVEDPVELKAPAGQRAVPDLIARVALPYLDNGGAAVEADDDDDEGEAGHVEARPAHGREDAAVQAQDRELGHANHDAVLDGRHVEPVGGLMGLGWRNVPAVLAAVVVHGGRHDGAVGDGAAPADGDEDILDDEGALDGDARVGAQQEEDSDEGDADAGRDAGEADERGRVVGVWRDARRRRQAGRKSRRRRRHLAERDDGARGRHLDLQAGMSSGARGRRWLRRGGRGQGACKPVRPSRTGMPVS